ncbi:hypothetical protein HDA34_002403 [Micrococcus yunnanensis]|uniref:Uncharacterized protein n=1 Tax=Micrococcus yunnanensis TaxID=566027 RepID=A0ABR6D5G4_9MICC|nr:hypothetical protein [Micrococcus yunnanensis]
MSASPADFLLHVPSSSADQAWIAYSTDTLPARAHAGRVRRDTPCAWRGPTAVRLHRDGVTTLMPHKRRKRAVVSLSADADTVTSAPTARRSRCPTWPRWRVSKITACSACLQDAGELRPGWRGPRAVRVNAISCTAGQRCCTLRGKTRPWPVLAHSIRSRVQAWHGGMSTTGPGLLMPRVEDGGASRASGLRALGPLACSTRSAHGSPEVADGPGQHAWTQCRAPGPEPEARAELATGRAPPRARRRVAPLTPRCVWLDPSQGRRPPAPHQGETPRTRDPSAPHATGAIGQPVTYVDRAWRRVHQLPRRRRGPPSARPQRRRTIAIRTVMSRRQTRHRPGTSRHGMASARRDAGRRGLRGR